MLIITENIAQNVEKTPKNQENTLFMLIIFKLMPI